jgi:hypothetical protein
MRPAVGICAEASISAVGAALAAIPLARTVDRGQGRSYKNRVRVIRDYATLFSIARSITSGGSAPDSATLLLKTKYGTPLTPCSRTLASCAAT